MSVDQRLYERLIQPIESQMIRTIWRIIRDPDEAEDVLQDTLGIIWKRLDRIRSTAGTPHRLASGSSHDGRAEIVVKIIRAPPLSWKF